jgi:hypothetical protein
MVSASQAYDWLSQKNYIGKGTEILTDPQQSPLSWYGGNMPPHGPTSLPTAKADMAAWSKAGAQND